MSQPSRISAEIPPSVLSECQTRLKEALDLLFPYLISLQPEDRKVLPKMSDKSVAFVKKTVSYSVTNPEFTPNFLDIPELNRDLKLTEDLKPVFDVALQLLLAVEDTMILSGSEAYVAALMYYNSVKAAAKRGLPKSKPVYEDLSVRFPGGRRSGDDGQA